jgi:peptide chain release factor 1
MSIVDKYHVDKLIKRLEKVESLLAGDTAINQQKRRIELLREYSMLQRIKEIAGRCTMLEKEIAEHERIAHDESEDAELRRLANEEVDTLMKKLEACEEELIEAIVSRDSEEHRNVIMEIRAGTGGNEAALFAGDLFRMYKKYAESKGWKVSIVDASSAEIGGYKEIVFSIEGEGAFGRLQFEGGVHRVQRIPVTEAYGRIHTSTATVAVLPEAEEQDDIVINPDDIRVDIFCSSGPGGQSVNTTYSAVRIVHLPTGLTVSCQDERSQHKNKERAMKVLKARLLDMQRQKREKEIGDMRRSMIGTGDRSERIRTYNFPQNRVTDHRINFTSYNLDRVIEGELDELISRLVKDNRRLLLQRELEKLTADTPQDT